MSFSGSNKYSKRLQSNLGMAHNADQRKNIPQLQNNKIIPCSSLSREAD